MRGNPTRRDRRAVARRRRSRVVRSRGTVPRPALRHARLMIAAAVLVGMSWTPRPAAAMPSAMTGAGGQNSNGSSAGRASQWDARRAEKKAQAPEAGSSSAFQFLGRLLSPAALQRYYSAEGGDGFGVVIGGRESEHGVQGGVRYTVDSLGKPFASRATPNRLGVSVRGIASPFGYRAAFGRFGVANVSGSPFDLWLDAAHERRGGETFYGLGPVSLPESAVDFDLVASRVGARLQWVAASDVSIGAGVDLLDYDQGAAEDIGVAAINDLLAAETRPTAGLDTRFLRQRIFLVVDRRDLPEYPHTGQYFAGAFENYQEQRLEGFDFQRWALDGRQYFPFLNDLRVIAVRGLVELTRTAGDNRVPFYLQPTLGGPDDMRGLPTFRFRGANKLLVQAEYRWQAWRGLDMALFFDGGQVFEEAAQIGFDRLQFGYGLGFRFQLDETQLLRIDAANGKEGFITHVSLNRIF